MGNEIAQWAVICIMGLMLLGLFRQFGLAQPAQQRAVSPGGPSLRKRAPKLLLDAVGSARPDRFLQGETVVAFVTEGCAACQHLLGDVARREQLPISLVLVARSPTPQFRTALSETGLSVFFDDEAKIWEACDIQATPLLVRLDPGGVVIAKEVTHRVDADALVA